MTPAHRAARVYHHLAEHAARRGIEPGRFKRAAREIETAGMRRVLHLVGKRMKEKR